MELGIGHGKDFEIEDIMEQIMDIVAESIDIPIATTKNIDFSCLHIGENVRRALNKWADKQMWLGTYMGAPCAGPIPRPEDPRSQNGKFTLWGWDVIVDDTLAVDEIRAVVNFKPTKLKTGTG